MLSHPMNVSHKHNFKSLNTALVDALVWLVMNKGLVNNSNGSSVEANVHTLHWGNIVIEFKKKLLLYYKFRKSVGDSEEVYNSFLLI